MPGRLGGVDDGWLIEEREVSTAALSRSGYQAPQPSGYCGLDALPLIHLNAVPEAVHDEQPAVGVYLNGCGSP